MVIMPQDNLPFGQDFLHFSVSSFVEKRKKDRLQMVSFFKLVHMVSIPLNPSFDRMMAANRSEGACPLSQFSNLLNVSRPSPILIWYHSFSKLNF